MRIDSHQHFTAEYSPDLLRPILKRNRFDAGVLVGGAEAMPFAAADFVVAVVVEADLAAESLPFQLDEFQRHPKFRGVCYPFDGDPLPSGLAELARRGLTLDLPPRPELVPAIAARYPTLRMVLDHVGRPSLMARPFDEWARDLEAAARHAPLCAKISGLIADRPGGCWKADDFRPVVRHALRTLGPDRLMYGSDWPRYLPEGTWKEALAAFTQSIGAMPLEIREHLLGLTAARFYSIDAGSAA
ncbi:MAG: amidohydrolase family protein [Acidobacteria bacterium]|nr:amidohydrolase family protein [Acidobacteriota bacterium]